MLRPPSPNDHSQEEALPVDEAVNWTALPVWGRSGECVKFAAGAWPTGGGDVGVGVGVGSRLVGVGVGPRARYPESATEAGLSPTAFVATTQ